MKGRDTEAHTHQEAVGGGKGAGKKKRNEANKKSDSCIYPNCETYGHSFCIKQEDCLKYPMLIKDITKMRSLSKCLLIIISIAISTIASAGSLIELKTQTIPCEGCYFAVFDKVKKDYKLTYITPNTPNMAIL